MAGAIRPLGCVVADMRHDRVQTVNRMLGQLDIAALDLELNSIADDTEQQLNKAGVEFSQVVREFSLDMLYLGQTHTVSVPLAFNRGGLTQAHIQEAFDAAYRESYGRLLEDIPTRVMNFRVAVIGKRPELDMKVFTPANGKSANDCRIGQRQVYADGKHHKADIYERLDLAVGEVVTGPALLEQPDTTIFVDPGLVARVDDFGNLLISPT